METLFERYRARNKRLDCITLQHPIRFTGGFGPSFVIMFRTPPSRMSQNLTISALDGEPFLFSHGSLKRARTPTLVVRDTAVNRVRSQCLALTATDKGLHG